MEWVWEPADDQNLVKFFSFLARTTWWNLADTIVQSCLPNFPLRAQKTQSVGYIDVLCCLQLLAVYLIMQTLRSYCDVRQVINRDTIVCTRNLDFRSISCCVTIYRLNFNIWRTYFADWLQEFDQDTWDNIPKRLGWILEVRHRDVCPVVTQLKCPVSRA